MGNFISGLVPEAKVKVAHGRQKEKELEKNIIDFLMVSLMYSYVPQL